MLEPARRPRDTTQEDQRDRHVRDSDRDTVVAIGASPTTIATYAHLPSSIRRHDGERASERIASASRHPVASASNTHGNAWSTSARCAGRNRHSATRAIGAISTAANAIRPTARDAEDDEDERPHYIELFFDGE